MPAFALGASGPAAGRTPPAHVRLVSGACALAGRPVPTRRGPNGTSACAPSFECGAQATAFTPQADVAPAALRVNWEDFVDHKMGRGEVFYGKSKARLSRERKEYGLDEEKPSPEENWRQGATLVVGATGGVGQWIALKLMARGVPVRVFVRNKAKAEGIFGPDGQNLDIAVGDLADPRHVARAVAGCEAVVIASGSRSPLGPGRPEKVDYEGTRALAEASRAAGVRHITLVSSLGTTRPEAFPLYRLFGDVLRWKRRGEEALEASGVPYTIIRPGGLRDEPGGLREVVLAPGDAAAPGGIGRMDVAELAAEAACLRHPALAFTCVSGPGLAAGGDEEEDGEEPEEGEEEEEDPQRGPTADAIDRVARG